MQRKLDDLSYQWKDKSQQYCKLILDIIDTESTELLFSAKKSCIKLRVGTVAFSPQLSKVGLTSIFW